MTLEPNTSPTPREQASQLVNDYASKQAALIAATAKTQAEITALQGALNVAAAPYKAEIEALEAEAKALALAHGPAIFGEGRSLIENGYKLALTLVEEVESDADEERVCRVILRELRDVEKRIAAAEAAGNHAQVQTLTFERIALSSLITTTHKLNKGYIKDNYDESADWFEMYGLRVVERDSASLKAAPKPKTPKPKAAKKPGKLKTVESEAAA
jgi:hypothetical protein